jgi:hypothetical protein
MGQGNTGMPGDAALYNPISSNPGPARCNYIDWLCIGAVALLIPFHTARVTGNHVIQADPLTCDAIEGTVCIAGNKSGMV